MIDKKFIQKFVWKGAVLFSAFALGCGVSYYYTLDLSDETIADLQQQVDDLKKKELRARVTQRVSVQMEEIASQQTLLSNKERDRANQQKIIADNERNKAEIEKGLAEKAQIRALASADEAERAKNIAEQQTKIATENMILAQRSQAHADTLMYFSLANSLAQSSLAQTDRQLSRLLAYSAWYFADNYLIDVSNLSNVYDALIHSATDANSYILGLKGNIRRLCLSGDEEIGVTDYGEVLVRGSKGAEYLAVGNYDFRDLVTNGRKDNTVLGVQGQLFTMDLTNLADALKPAQIDFRQRLQLPEDLWYRLITADDGNTLIAMGRHTVAWIDAKTYKLEASYKAQLPLSTIGMQKGILHIFDEDGHHYISDKAGIVAQMDLQDIKSSVTAYLYDSEKGYHILGMYNGMIYIYDKNGVRLSILTGHTGSVTDLHTRGQLLCSSSNDQSVDIWDISNLSSIITPVSVAETHKPQSFAIDKNTGYVYVGDGPLISVFCCDVIHNAQSVLGSLRREFTDEEWNHYIGRGIPYVKFMK